MKDKELEKKESTCVQQKPFKADLHLVFKYEYDEEKGTTKMAAIELAEGKKLSLESAEEFLAIARKTAGTEDLVRASKLLGELSFGMTENSHSERINSLAHKLPSLAPEDETETRIAAQFIALQESGLNCLRQANYTENFYHVERFFQLANKLLSTANQTMQTLLKYRTKGQQVMQVVHLHNEGQAIVAQTLAAPKVRESIIKPVIEPHE